VHVLHHVMQIIIVSLFEMVPRGALSSGDVKRKEFHCSRLFKVTGRLIGITGKSNQFPFWEL